ncbi:MAG TPA: response regulator [Bacteroidales bacterium]|nr:response regulator [Bacteroidales bacterium]HSA44310.1 response regulator [Bacteroidales bacterium]
MNKKILLIDDDEDLLRSFQVNLEIYGYEVFTAPDSRQGMLLIEKEKPDFIVLDVMMNSNLEGYNFLHQIKGNPDWKQIPVLMLTGMVDQLGVNLFSAVDDEKLFPHVRFHDKPIAPLDLVEIIEEMLPRE